MQWLALADMQGEETDAVARADAVETQGIVAVTDAEERGLLCLLDERREVGQRGAARDPAGCETARRARTGARRCGSAAHRDRDRGSHVVPGPRRSAGRCDARGGLLPPDPQWSGRPGPAEMPRAHPASGRWRGPTLAAARDSLSGSTLAMRTRPPLTSTASVSLASGLVNALRCRLQTFARSRQRPVNIRAHDRPVAPASRAALEEPVA